MKIKKNKKIFLSLISVLFVCLCADIGKNKIEVKAQANEVVQAFYKSQYKFEQTPNTFTATFKIDPMEFEADAAAKTKRDMIISNCATDSTTNLISIFLNENGNIYFNWNKGQKTITFNSKNFRTGEWEHITIVRNHERNSFCLYEEGQLLQEISGGIGSDITGTYAPAIGNNLRPSGGSSPFRGEIKDVALYTTALNDAEVLAEYQITDKKSITKDNSTVLYNWVLDGKAQKLVYEEDMPKWVYDYSGNENHAYLCTSFHWYEANTNKDDPWYKANEDEYTFVFYPDIQETVHYQRELIYKQNQWVADNAETMNLKAVLTLGDLTNGIYGNWYTAEDAFRIFEEANIPYIPLLGNHDYDDQKNTIDGGRETLHFNEFFPYENYASKEYFLEAKEPGKMDNIVYKFDALGVNYLVFAIEFGPEDSTLEWVSSILDRPEYVDYRAIITSHNIVGRNGCFTDTTNGATTYGFSNAEGITVNNGIDMWDKLLSKHDNIFFSASGHVVTDSVMKRIDVGDNGNEVLSMLINGQSVKDVYAVRGATLVFLCKINEKTKKMTCNYYDPVNDLYFCVENQFEYDFSNWFSKKINASEGISIDANRKPGETVNFTIDLDENTTKHSLVATDTKGNNITINQNGSNYSLVMPETRLNIELVQLDESKITLPSELLVERNRTIDLNSYLPEGLKYLFNQSDLLTIDNNILKANKVGEFTLEISVNGLGKIAQTNVKVIPYNCNGNHIFDQQIVDEKHLVNEATCSSKAKYYYSCDCGENGVSTFTVGEVKGHTYACESSCCDKVCVDCGNAVEGDSIHNWISESIDGNNGYTCKDCNAKMTLNSNTQGCKGSLATSSGLLSLLFIALLLKKKSKEI